MKTSPAPVLHTTHTSHCGPWNNARASVPILVIRASFTETQEFLFLKLVNLGTLLSIIITIDLEHINLPPNNLLIVRSCQPVSGSGYLEWSTSSWLLTFVTMPGNVVMVKEENTIHQTYLDLVYIINVRMWISEINELNKMYIYECGPGARCVEMSWPWWAPALLRSSTSHLSASHSTSRVGNMQGWTFILYCMQYANTGYISTHCHCWSEEESVPFNLQSMCIKLLQPFKHLYSYS